MQPGSGKSIFAAAAKVLNRLGGHVSLDPEGENLIRLRSDRDAAGYDYVIEVQGLPNLIHELVHVLFFGRLAEDGGFDYRLVPLDVRRAEHRRWLCEEIACCVVSCAYWDPYPKRPDTAPTQAVHVWFADQLSALPVFYGYEREPSRFFHALAKMHDDPVRRDEIARTIDRAYALVRGAIFDVGGSIGEAMPPASYKFGDLWREFERGMAG